MTLIKVKGHILPVKKFSHTIDNNCQNHFDRPYINGDIQLRIYCSGVGCLKTGETNKLPLFKGRLIISVVISISLFGMRKYTGVGDKDQLPT